MDDTAVAKAMKDAFTSGLLTGIIFTTVWHLGWDLILWSMK